MTTFSMTPNPMFAANQTSFDGLGLTDSLMNELTTTMYSNSFMAPLNHSQFMSDAHVELHLFKFNWASVKYYLVVTIFLLIAIVIKILHANVKLIHTYLPESCLLIICGFSVGFAKNHFDGDFFVPSFSMEIFFYLLIPPIMLEAAFSLHDKVFFENIGTILSFAVIGTILNVALIAGSLYVCSYTSIFSPAKFTVVEFVVFSIIISAIDPVAVLTIFEEINVNKDIYFLVFGESLLNDAVVITLYNTVITLRSFDNLEALQVGTAIASFVVVSIGGVFCGLVLGILTTFAAKHCQKVRVVEPLLLLVFAYLSYVLGELFHLSGIISMICCGVVQAQFARLNISKKSFITVRYITKTLSALADNVIFIFLGMLLAQQNHFFNPGFFGASFFFAILHRFVAIYLLSFFSNCIYKRSRLIHPNEQFLIAYGGLRGAIAFSLAFSLPPFLAQRQLLTSSTLQLVVASVFIFGCTMKPIVRRLCISSDTTPELSLLEVTNRRMQMHTLAAVEALAGQPSFNALAESFTRLNEYHLRPLLVTSPAMRNQLAVEMRSVYEQLLVKSVAPQPTRYAGLLPGMTKPFVQLFQRVRRLSSLRMGSATSPKPIPNGQASRGSDQFPDMPLCLNVRSTDSGLLNISQDNWNGDSNTFNPIPHSWTASQNFQTNAFLQPWLNQTVSTNEHASQKKSQNNQTDNGKLLQVFIQMSEDQNKSVIKEEKDTFLSKEDLNTSLQKTSEILLNKNDVLKDEQRPKVSQFGVYNLSTIQTEQSSVNLNSIQSDAISKNAFSPIED